MTALRAIICPPTGPGSLGDDAMIGALASGLVARGYAVDVMPTAHDVESWTFVDGIDAQIDFPRGGLRRVTPRLLMILRRYERVYLLGADVLDGHYENGTVRRMLFATALASVACRRTTVVGFSYNSTPSPTSVRLFRLLPPWVRIYLRDQPSLERFRRATGRRRTMLSADVAFLLEPVGAVGDEVRELMEWSRAMRAAGRKVVAFNAGGASFVGGLGQVSGASIAEAYTRELNALLSRRSDVAVALVAHDHRQVVGEHALLRAIESGIDPAAKGRVAALISPAVRSAEIKRLIGGFDLLCGSRMHFAVAAFSAGVPAASIAYQGKFEGLYRHFGLEGPLMSLEQSLVPGALESFINDALAEGDALRDRIGRALPHVRRLAAVNIDGPGALAAQSSGQLVPRP